MIKKTLDQQLKKASEIIKKSKRTCFFSGAGLSVESGIPCFRGPKGIWNMIDPGFIEINYFLNNPNESWKLIKKYFYDFLDDIKPNDAHKGITKLQNMGYIKTVITQNIDCLHQAAKNKNVYEYHGTLEYMVCMNCGLRVKSSNIQLDTLPPLCDKCRGLLKPDFVFFGEPIPFKAQDQADYEIKNSDCFIVTGTTGEVVPAGLIPMYAKRNGSKIIEINTEKSNYTDYITDVFLQGKATQIISALVKELTE